MMTGMPVIVSNVGGIPEFVDDECGFISNLKIGNFKNNIIKLYNLNIISKEKIALCAHKKAIKTSSYENTIQKEITFLKNVIEK